MRFTVFILLFSFHICYSQNIIRQLIKAQSLQFKNAVYVYGFSENKNTLDLKIYKSDFTINFTDSVIVSIGKDKAHDFLDISYDTLHGFINFYLQKSNHKNSGTLIRISESLKLICKKENIESSKINSLTRFENETLNFNQCTYIIKTITDSSGKQFFLSKYEVIDVEKTFEYKQKWQFPFEKRDIHSAHVFYTDSQIVLVYVTVLTGEKKGQWVLKLNADKGNLIKGTRISNKSENKLFLLSSFLYNSKNKELILVGNTYSEQQINLKNNVFSFSGLNKSNTFFFVKTDSLGEIISKQEKTMPASITYTAKPNTKQVFFYHFKITEIKQTPDNTFSASGFIYKSSGQNLILTYETGFDFTFSINENDFTFLPQKIYCNTCCIPQFTTNDTKNLTGKTTLNSISDFASFLIKPLLFPVQLIKDSDNSGFPKWVLCNNDIKSGLLTFYDVRAGVKGLNQQTIFQDSKYNYPKVYRGETGELILFKYVPETFTFSLYKQKW